ncbi:MAG: hypothetical protein DRP89_00300 [Candidatus Neomarinimicrobiota bacterium]|nr:MAG: hypothetical protein DRP89_00300 [Candidatus Neomarinimicrobiota bacterium]
MYYYPREIDKKWYSISNYTIKMPGVKIEIEYCKSHGKSIIKYAIFNRKGVASCFTTLYIH